MLLDIRVFAPENVACVCVLCIFSLTGLPSFKDCGLWRDLRLCSVESRMSKITFPS